MFEASFFGEAFFISRKGAKVQRGFQVTECLCITAFSLRLCEKFACHEFLSGSLSKYVSGLSFFSTSENCVYRILSFI